MCVSVFFFFGNFVSVTGFDNITKSKDQIYSKWVNSKFNASFLQDRRNVLYGHWRNGVVQHRLTFSECFFFS